MGRGEGRLEEEGCTTRLTLRGGAKGATVAWGQASKGGRWEGSSHGKGRFKQAVTQLSAPTNPHRPTHPHTIKHENIPHTPLSHLHLCEWNRSPQCPRCHDPPLNSWLQGR